MTKKKIIEAYFLQKTGGTYNEQSLYFLLDLLRREGLANESSSIEQIGASLATLVRNGSHLRVVTKKLPEHIRAQIDFSLQKTKKSKANASSHRGQQSTFDDLLASLDSDDPKFTMDTTLGLEFSSLEELEADLKKRALNTISPILFRKSASSSLEDAEMREQDYREQEYHNAESVDARAALRESEEFSTDVRLSQRQAQELRNHQISAENFSDSSDSSEFSGFNSESQNIQNEQNIKKMSQIQSVSQMPQISHHVPQFPDDSQLANNFMSNNLMSNNLSNNLFSSQQNLPQNLQQYSQLSAQQSHSTQVPQISIQTVFALNDLRMRAALLDAKERLLTQRIGSLQDPILLRALSYLDERMIQLRDQNSQQNSMNQQNSMQQFQPQQFQSLQPPLQLSGSSLHTNGQHLHEHSHSSSHSPVTQLRAQIADMITLQKSMQQLQQVFTHNSNNSLLSAQASLRGDVQQLLAQRAQNNGSNNGESKNEVKKLRTQVTSLQDQLGALTSQIQNLIGQVSRDNIKSHKASLNKHKHVKSLRASAVHSHELTDSQRQNLSTSLSENFPLSKAQSVEPVVALSPVPDISLLTSPPSFSSGLSGNDESTLLRIYTLLAQGMNELPISVTRAKSIYGQLQKLYVTLSVEQKPIVYPSIVDFHSLLANQLRDQRDPLDKRNSRDTGDNIDMSGVGGVR